MHLEAAIWNLFISDEFFEKAAQECEDMTAWFGTLAISRRIGNLGRNNQIFDTFKALARDFRRGAEMARLNDYKLVWDTARCFPGDVRGMMEQPLHSWMSETEYQEFSGARIGRLMSYTTQIENALYNAIMGADSFFNPNPNWPEGSNNDYGFPDSDIVDTYNSEMDWYKGQLHWVLPDPVPEYVINKAIACRTGDEVPWTGVWYPATGLEKHSLTFAIKGKRMQPVFHVLRTSKELATKENMFPSAETVALATTWYQLLPSGRPASTNQELRAKAGEPCPKAGTWQPMEPGAKPRNYVAGETMANLGSAYGITVWQWIGDR